MSRLACVALVVAACGGGSSSTPDALDLPTVFGGARPTTLQIPTGFDPAKTYPLVVILHGYGASGELQELYFNGNAIPAAGTAFVLAPDGLVDSTGAQYWNADPACCDIDHTNPDDAAYIGGLIDDVSAAWPIDKGAVTILGHSNGGYMAYKMACARADVVSNIVVLAGSAATDPTTCTPSRAVPVLHIHGTTDSEVPYAVAMPSVQQWAAHDGCGSAMTMTAGPDMDIDMNITGDETTTATMDGCPTGITIELWSIVGGDHLPAIKTDFATMILAYAMAHRRPAP